MHNGLRSIPLYRLAEGVLTAAQERRFDAINGTADEKIERLGLLICEDVVTAAAVELEEQRLGERRRAIQNRIARRKEFLRHIMQRFKKRQVAGVLCSVTLQQNATVSVSTDAISSSGQPDLFSGGRAHHRRERGQHIRVR